LHTKRFGKRVYYYPVTDSTNNVAMALAKLGEAGGTVVVTDFQTRGKGRLDHEWSSRAGEDLLFTVIVRPPSPPATLLPITLVFAVAIAEGLAATVGVDVSVKWPNDIVTPRGKIGGILAEGSVTAPERSFAVVGTGINVNSRADSFPVDLRGRVATCRTESGREWDRAELLAGVLGWMEGGYERFLAEGFAGARATYESRLTLIGRRVSFVSRHRRVTARVEGVEDDGALRVVADESEERMRLYGEEVTPVA
jgi:BirA family biotin operon repressor/biotin-[acetyl-CoA-carboxylase] ligase